MADQAPLDQLDHDDLYGTLAPVYDDWQRLGGVTPFWALTLAYLEPALARGDASAPVTSFIDLGCGTGELLRALAARHPDWRLTGVDGSEPMLAMARGKPGAQAVTWVRRDLRALDAAPAQDALTGFAAAGAFHDTLNHLPDAAALALLFGAVARRLLRPGGLLIFDVTNQVGFAHWWKGLSTWGGPDWEIRSQLSYEPGARHLGGGEGGTGRALVTVLRGGTAARFQLTQRCFPEAAIRHALASAGFQVESAKSWSPFEIDAPGKTIWIARKSS